EFNVFNIVFSSSATVYGHPQYLPIDESHPVAPTNPYGHSKLMCEQIARDMSVADPRFRIALLRYFNPIGAHESGLIGEDPSSTPANLLPYVTQVLVGRLPHLRVFGSDYETVDGTGVRDFVHVVDLAKGHLAALDYLATTVIPADAAKGANCFTWNMGTGKGYSVLEVVKATEMAARKTVPIEMNPRRPGDCGEVVADTSRANSDLKWTANLGINDMVASAWFFQRFHPEGYATTAELRMLAQSVPCIDPPGAIAADSGDDTDFDSMSDSAKPEMPEIKKIIAPRKPDALDMKPIGRFDSSATLITDSTKNAVTSSTKSMRRSIFSNWWK
ncbi:hypothetical protein HDU93_008522, partial [Gonapodya sp. JEL0774]